MRPTQKPKTQTKGFALIVTLTLMVLLTILALGLLTLSSVTLRASGSGSDLAVARANARLALSLAIGDLQKHAGTDTRITAKADILDEKNPQVLGVWRSWEGTDHEQSGTYQGRPVSPGNYAAKKKERFMSWLVSGDTTVMPDMTQTPNKVTLLGKNSLGNGPDRDKLQVHLTPTNVKGKSQQGSFAWWVSGENQKARLPKPYEPTADTSARWAVNSKSHSIADPKPFRLDGLLTDPAQADKSITLKQTDLVSSGAAMKSSQEFFHDLSTSSVGLLTNVATGGWKKDLSLLTEGYASGSTFSPGSSNLPFFRVKPGTDIAFNMPSTGSATPDKSMIYPWAAYRGDTSKPAIYRHGAVSSWENLKDYALLYKDSKMTTPTNGKFTFTPTSVPIDVTGDQDTFGFLHRVRVLPIIARIQWVFSHYSEATTVAGAPAGSLEPRLLLTPVITLWNPYNVEMGFDGVPITLNIPRPLPAALKYTIGGVTQSAFHSLTSGSLNYTSPLANVGSLTYRITSAFRLQPGETRVFSPTSTDRQAAGASLTLLEGYTPGGGHYFTIKSDAGLPYAAPTAMLNVASNFDTTYDDSAATGNSAGSGVGIYLDMNYNYQAYGDRRALVYRMVYPPAIAASVYKPLDSTQLAGGTLSSFRSSPKPFMTTVFGARMASKTHLAAKGFVQSSPLVNYTAMGGKDVVESTIGRHYAGTNHPVNSPFDYSFAAVGGAGDSTYPNASDSTRRGYIVTGFNKSDGLSRCVIAELPTRPLQSLGELQNWDLRYENPIPPFAFNLIGNSDATPLIASNSAVGNYADAVNLQYDDSYCANHLLFDDWFFSSIAPNPTNYGNAGSTLQKTYTDFVSNITPLGNRAYVPIAQDAGSSSTNATKLYTTYINKADSWQKIASRLEVEGMFNVNSTSVTAWRALIGHARNQRVPYIKDTVSTWALDLAGKADYAFSRFSIAGDSEAKTTGTSGAFPGAAEFSGYRILDEKVLDALAKEIVNQVRQRGPFLSLSEFINRQLSSGDLALAGTIQAALDQIAKAGSTSPYAGILAVNDRQATNISTAEYKFPDAANGQATYGLPGWTRQADILRQIAPILNARDDTFTIRAYGDARDKTGKITARATCEAVVRRTREYVDASDLAEITTLPTKPINKSFGRRFQLLSVRWLNPSEV